MRRVIALAFALVAVIAAIFTLTRRSAVESRWTTEFATSPDEFMSTGHNTFFNLEPGYQLVLADSTTELTITVLEETRVVDNVQTRVVEEREVENGAVIEVSRNYFAISRRTNSVYYFGEEVDMYEGGKVVAHTGAWLSGVDGARFGLIMPGEPLIGARYYQEMATNAMDRAEIISLSDTMRFMGSTLNGLLKTVESTPLERGVLEYKYYAPGIGMVRDGTLRLVRNGIADTIR